MRGGTFIAVALLYALAEAGTSAKGGTTAGGARSEAAQRKERSLNRPNGRRSSRSSTGNDQSARAADYSDSDRGRRQQGSLGSTRGRNERGTSRVDGIDSAWGTDDVEDEHADDVMDSRGYEEDDADDDWGVGDEEEEEEEEGGEDEYAGSPGSDFDLDEVDEALEEMQDEIAEYSNGGNGARRGKGGGGRGSARHRRGQSSDPQDDFFPRTGGGSVDRRRSRQSPASEKKKPKKKSGGGVMKTMGSATGKSMKAMVHALQPKSVGLGEILDTWKIEQMIGQAPGRVARCAATVEFRRDGTVATSFDGRESVTDFTFRAHAWPRACTIEFEARAFQGPYDEEPVWKVYKGSFSRKLLDPKIITLEGAIYDVTGKMLWKRRVKSGRFVARRRPSRVSRGAGGGRGRGSLGAGRRSSGRGKIAQRREEKEMEEEENGEVEDGSEEWEIEGGEGVQSSGDGQPRRRASSVAGRGSRVGGDGGRKRKRKGDRERSRRQEL